MPLLRRIWTATALWCLVLIIIFFYCSRRWVALFLKSSICEQMFVFFHLTILSFLWDDLLLVCFERRFRNWLAIPAVAVQLFLIDYLLRFLLLPVVHDQWQFCEEFVVLLVPYLEGLQRRGIQRKAIWTWYVDAWIELRAAAAWVFDLLINRLTANLIRVLVIFWIAYRMRLPVPVDRRDVHVWDGSAAKKKLEMDSRSLNTNWIA